MTDWFVVLTPILLLVIGYLFFYIGCTFDPSTPSLRAEVTFYIEFYVVNSIRDHDFEFEITDVATGALATDSGKLNLLESGANTTKVSFSFKRFLDDGPVSLTCAVTDLNTGGAPLLAGGDGCEDKFFEQSEHHIVKFLAGVSADGMTPTDEFDLCSFATY